MKKNVLKTILAAVLSLLMVLSMTACNNDPKPVPTGSGSEDDGGYRAVDTSVTHDWDVTKEVDENFDLEQYIKDEKAKWYLGYEAKLQAWTPFPWKDCNRGFQNYSALNTVKEITGISLTCDVALQAASESLYMFMVNGEWPDIITFDGNDPVLNEVIEGGYVYSLDELAEQYDPDFLKSIPEPMIQAGQVINGDDRVWGIVSMLVSDWQYKDGVAQTNLGNCGYNVRHDIYEALGEPDISTPDKLFDALMLFKEKYPTLDGKDSIALGGYGNGGDGTLLALGYSFGLKQDISINYEDNSVTTRFLDPHFEDFAVFMNKLYRNGLLDKEFFMKNTSQSTESAASNVFMMPWVYHAMNDANAILRMTDPESVFVAIPPMSATGKDYTYRGNSRATGSSITLITKKCSDPAAALRFLRYGCSAEGCRQLYKGNPGTHYLVKNGVFYQTDEVFNEINGSNFSEWNLTEGIQDYYWTYYSPTPEADQVYPLREEFDIPNTYPYSYDGTNELFNMTVNYSSDEGIAYSYIISIASVEQAKAIFAESEEECRSIIKAMQEDIRKVNNFDKLEAFWTNQYRANLEKFGEAKWGNPDAWGK